MMPAGICRSRPMRGAGAVPSLIARWKPNVIVVGVPSRSGLDEALSVAARKRPASALGVEPLLRCGYYGLRRSTMSAMISKSFVL